MDMLKGDAVIANLSLVVVRLDERVKTLENKQNPAHHNDICPELHPSTPDRPASVGEAWRKMIQMQDTIDRQRQEITRLNMELG